VTVLKLIAEGHTYEQVLTHHPSLTYPDIFDAAREALEVAGEAPSAYQKRLAKIRQVYPRAYEKWTDEEDATLSQLARSGHSVEEIVNQLQRQPSAVLSRIAKRNLVEDEGSYW
jgi:hypothetical protein